MGPDGGYRLGAGADLPPLLFDDEQAVALAVALQLAATTGAGIADAAWRALSTVRQVMPGAPAAPGRRRPGHRAAAPGRRRGRHRRCSWRSPTRRATASSCASTTSPAPGTPATDGPPRRVEPHHVVHRGGRWYLLAWDLERDDWRTFRVDRLAPRTPTGPRFTPREVPGGDVAAFVAARFRGSREPRRR